MRRILDVETEEGAINLAYLAALGEMYGVMMTGLLRVEGDKRSEEEREAQVIANFQEGILLARRARELMLSILKVKP
jgi:hypothetical protein